MKRDDNTTFPEWLEQFANLAGWGVVNLKIRLKQSAYAFLHSYTPQQRGNYSAIVLVPVHRRVVS